MQTVPFRVNEAGDGLAPLWLPTKPKRSVLPPLAARLAFQLTGVTITFWPLAAKVAFQVLPETDSVLAGKREGEGPPGDRVRAGVGDADVGDESTAPAAGHVVGHGAGTVARRADGEGHRL